MVKLDQDLLPSGNAKGFFGYLFQLLEKVTRSQSAALRNTNMQIISKNAKLGKITNT